MHDWVVVGFKERLRDVIGGAPTDVYESKLASSSQPAEAQERQAVGTASGEERSR